MKQIRVFALGAILLAMNACAPSLFAASPATQTQAAATALQMTWQAPMTQAAATAFVELTQMAPTTAPAIPTVPKPPVISVENAPQIIQLARLGEGTAGDSSSWSADGKMLAVG